MEKINNRLYAATLKGLCVFDRQRFELIPGSEQFSNGLKISSMLPFDSQRMLIATQNDGLYLYDGRSFSRWKTDVDDLLYANHINRALVVSDSLFVFGTIRSGVIAIDRQGRLLWHLNKSNGLQNNTVLGLHEDREGNIWVALDNGVDYIDVQSPLYFYRGNYDNVEAVYDICENQGTLYLATNRGLFYSRGGNKSFRMLAGTYEQVWSLALHDKQLLCGHNTGTSRIEGDKAIAVSDVTGGYCIRRYRIKEEDVLIQSTYTRLVVYKKNTEGFWQKHHTVADFVEPVRYIEIDYQGNIWAGHIEKNVFRIRLNEDLTRIDDLRRYTSIGNRPANRTGVFKVNSQIVFTTGRLLYTYDAINDTIIPYDKLNEQLGYFASAHKIVATNDGRYWFFGEDELACFAFDAAGNCRMTHRISNQSLKTPTIFDNECIYTNGKGCALIGLMNGFAVFNGDWKPQSTIKTTILLRKIEASHSNMKFTFACPAFSAPDVRLFYQLEGLEKTLSPVSASYEKEYSRIPPGNYRFVLKAIDNAGNELAETSYRFTIAPPWYATKTAFAGYVSLGLLLLGFAYRTGALRLRRQHEQVLLAEEKKQQEELAHKEQKIIRLKNEKLESEVLYKAKELATSAMAIIQKNNILQMLKQELQKEESSKNTKNIVRLINKNLSSEKDWELFEANFDLIHDCFFRNLKKRSPHLTPADLKLCAYLRLNFSTKEIAQLTGNSVRGVEVARYRLRKKLQLTQEQNLNIFMLEFKGE
jgi:DNA-binding CsgD family transcriptional regulator